MATQVKESQSTLGFLCGRTQEIKCIHVSKKISVQINTVHLFIFEQMQFPHNMTVVVFSVFEFGCPCNCIYSPNIHIYLRDGSS